VEVVQKLCDFTGAETYVYVARDLVNPMI
jgi:hypothetical protein